jgi:L-alanine-DL-glutamate epimerase-like enolase superfamily enzyme
MTHRITRRGWLAGALGALTLPRLAPGAAETLADHRIARVTTFDFTAPRPKFVGKNARLGDHGDHTADSVVWLVTDRGAEGYGSGRIGREAAQLLVGRTVDTLWDAHAGSTGPLGRADHALFDLVSKILGVPGWKLIGEEGAEAVEVYDGSIYFADLIPEHSARGVSRLVEEVEAGLGRGFRAFKIKVGRGNRWMPRSEGDARDVEVVRAIRAAVGPGVKLMVDANNGYDRAGAERFLDAVADCDVFFAEEMFPEDPDEDRRFREHIAAAGRSTLVADGESAGDPAHFDPYLDTGTLDVLQPDIRAFGLSLQWALGRSMLERAPAMKLAPHNWGSHLGLPMQLLLGRALPNFLMAECDWAETDLFDASAFAWADGKVRVPDAPGCGLVLRKDVFEARHARDAFTAS